MERKPESVSIPNEAVDFGFAGIRAPQIGRQTNAKESFQSMNTVRFLSRATGTPPDAPAPRGARSGFTLIEVTLVVVIVALLATLAMPAFQNVRDHANVSKFMNDLRVLSSQFESYHFAQARWPGSAHPGELPPEMEGYVSSSTFAQPNSVGGRWTWYKSDTVTGIAVTYGDSDSELLLYQRIAEQIDDGDLFGGRFQLIGKAMVVWILEQ